MFTSRLGSSNSCLLKLIDMNDSCTLICQRIMIKRNVMILMFPNFFSLSLSWKVKHFYVFDSWGQFSFLFWCKVPHREVAYSIICSSWEVEWRTRLLWTGTDVRRYQNHLEQKDEGTSLKKMGFVLFLPNGSYFFRDRFVSLTQIHLSASKWIF